ncbi:MAG TPA: segregation/condensation protein A [Propionibacteriaceae bacterium]|nr:segregation/condensation protein A [Propionibacteriaceae bacterium]
MTEESVGTRAEQFSVHLENFSGPFDLLLQLISRHKLDVTEIALAAVTDEFISHIRAQGNAWDLEQTSQFLVVASTLLDLKTARLLPQGEVEDLEDLALLEARDLLFARLLQYRAFKQVAAWIDETLATEGQRYVRPGGLEPQFAALLPDVEIDLSPDAFAALAARAMEPRAAVEVSVAHIHQVRVSVAEQAVVVAERLRRSGSATFRALVSDAPDKLTVVARFLALLELFRSASVQFEQMTPLGEIVVRWTGTTSGEVEVSDEFDEPAAPAGEE